MIIKSIDINSESLVLGDITYPISNGYACVPEEVGKNLVKFPQWSENSEVVDAEIMAIIAPVVEMQQDMSVTPVDTTLTDTTTTDTSTDSKNKKK